MLPSHQAEALILENVPLPDRPADIEELQLTAAAGRVLAEPVVSQLDFPHWDNSAMDGYAVRYEDVQTVSAEQPIALEIIEEIPAGYQPQKTVGAGQAARIFTGSVMPAGADTIVIQEETQRQDNTVTILSAPKPQAFVRQRAAFYQAGTPLLPAGTRLNAAEIAVLAAAQCAQVAVYRPPIVAVLSTGSELVGIDQPLQPGQIVDSNQYALTTLIAQAGAIPLPLGIVPDQAEALKAAMQHAIASADIVLSSGGVSVGDYDYVDGILAELGATIHVRSVAIKPGKPLTFATIAPDKSGSGNAPTLYFGLPGNPVSALVTFWRFVQPALRKRSGYPETQWTIAPVIAKTRSRLLSDSKRESYIWGRLSLVAGSYEFEAAGGSHSSGNLINLIGTSGLAIVPAGLDPLESGASVSVLPV